MRLALFMATGLASLLAVTSLAGISLAQEGSRMLRPVGTVEYRPEPAAEQRGVFRIRREDQRMRAVSVRAEAGSAEISGLRVTYDDGSVERIRVRESLRQGDELDPIRLESDGSLVTSVEVSYLPRGAVTLVLLAGGRRSEPAPPPAPPPVREEWVEIGCAKVSFLSDADRMAVTAPDLFKALRIRTVGGAVRVEQMGVRFENGARDVYQVKTDIPGNSRTGPIDLRGGERRINQLDFIYGSGVIAGAKPRLCVDGLKTGR